MKKLTLVIAVCCQGLLAADFDVPANLKTKYPHLYQASVERQSDGSFRFDKGRRFTRRGVNVLYLKGDRFEMAFQHGRLMKEEISRGAVPDAALALGKTVQSEIGDIPVVTKSAKKLVYRSITRKMFEYGLENQPANAGDPMLDGYGLSEGSGLPLKTIVYAALGPESMSVLLGNNLNGHTFSSGASPNQCSSFVAWGDATSDGELLIGRNTDYPLNGSYDRYPTAIYFNPTDGKQKFMAVTSAGLHNAGVVGMNESGIYVDVHTVPTRDVSAEGMPVFMIAQEVLRNAKSFDDALSIFNRYRTASGWTYVLVSTREKRASTIELSHTGIGIRPANGDTLIQTNHYMTPEMQSRFEPVNPTTVGDSLARYRRIQAILEAKRGKIDLSVAAGILGDKWDVDKQAPAWLGNTVAVHTTMTSAILQPALGRLFVANGTAPVSQSEYVELPLVHLDPATFASGEFSFFANDQYKRDFPNQAEAEQLFIQAKIAFENEIDIPKSIGLLQKSLEKDPGVPGVRFILGILHLREKQWEEAAGHFAGLLQQSDTHYALLGHFYLGKLLAVGGKEAEAAPQLQAILALADPAKEAYLIKASVALLETLQKRGRVKFKMMDLPLMFQQADMVSYK